MGQEMETAISQIIMLTSEGMQLEQALYRVLSKYNMEAKKNEMIVSDNSWEADVEMYLARRLISGIKQSSIEQYKHHLVAFFQTVSKPVKDITEMDVTNYLAYKRLKHGVNDKSLSNIERNINAFFSWQTKKGYLDKNPMDAMERVHVDKKVFYAFTDEELELIRRACKTARDRAIIEVLYSTGCRVSELVNIKIEDVDFKRNEVKIIRGKGGKDRLVYLTEIAEMYLNKYMSTREDTSEYLFVSQRKPHGQLSIDAVERIAKRIEKETGVKKVHPHRFRRTLATNLINRGMPVQEVQQILGHESLETTMVYCNVAAENVKHNHSVCA